jgi:hypothetical protein
MIASQGKDPCDVAPGEDGWTAGRELADGANSMTRLDAYGLHVSSDDAAACTAFEEAVHGLATP